MAKRGRKSKKCACLHILHEKDARDFAIEALAKAKEQEKGKQFIKVPIDKHTYKLVEISKWEKMFETT